MHSAAAAAAASASASAHTAAAMSSAAQPASASAQAAASSSTSAAPAAPAAPAAWRCPNDVLRRLFPAGSLHSLLDFLTSPRVGLSRSHLLRDSDPQPYRTLLTTTILGEMSKVAAMYAAPPSAAAGGATLAIAPAANRSSSSGFPSDHISLSSWLHVPAVPRCDTASSASASASASAPSKSEGMRSLLLHAIESLLSRGQHLSVLTLGYAKLDNYRNRSGIGSMYIHNVETNTVVTELQNSAWATLLARTSDELLMWMMMHTALFAALDNGCVVQLTGPQVVKLHRAINLAIAQAAAPPPVISRRQLNQSPQQQQPAGMLVRSNSLPSATPASSSFRTNPSLLMPPPQLPARAPSVGASAFASSATAAAAAAAAAPPRRRPRSRVARLVFVSPSTPLPRSTMFYKAPLKREVGLPSAHVLHRCAPSKRGAIRLVAQIFGFAPDSLTAAAAAAGAAAAPTRAASMKAALAPQQGAGLRLTRSFSNPLLVSPPRTAAVAAASASGSGAAPRVVKPAAAAAPSIALTHHALNTLVAAPRPPSAAAPDALSSLSFLPSCVPTSAAAAAATTAAASHPAQPKKKKNQNRVRIKSDARKEKRRLQLETRESTGGARVVRSYAPPAAVLSAAAVAPPPRAVFAKSPAPAPAAAAAAAAPARAQPPPPLPVARIPARLLPLLPLLESMLRRHRACAYARWLHESCPWTLPRGYALPKPIEPFAGKRQKQAAAAAVPVAEATMMDCAEPEAAAASSSASAALAASSLLAASSMGDGAQPMSLDAPSTPRRASLSAGSGAAVPAVAGAPSAPASASTPSASFPSLSSRLSSSHVSPIVSQKSQQAPSSSSSSRRNSRHSRSSRTSPAVHPHGGTPLSQAPSSAPASAEDADVRDRPLYHTQAPDSDDEDAAIARGRRDTRPIPMQSLASAGGAASVSLEAAAASPHSISQPFHPPSLAAHSGAMEQQQQHGIFSSPSSDATAEALLRQLEAASSASAAASASHSSPVLAPAAATARPPARRMSRGVGTHAAAGSGSCSIAASSPFFTPASTSPSQPAGASSSSASHQGSAGPASQQSMLSKSQRKRQKRRDLHSRHAAAQPTAALQTQTPSRRALAMMSSGSKSRAPKAEPFMPLSQIPLSVLLQMSCPSSSVTSFLVRVCMQLLPSSLLGPTRRAAQEWLRRVCSVFVRLRRFETVSTAQMMRGIKIGQIAWINLKRRDGKGGQDDPKAKRGAAASDAADVAASSAPFASDPSQSRALNSSRKKKNKSKRKQKTADRMADAPVLPSLHGAPAPAASFAAPRSKPASQKKQKRPSRVSTMLDDDLSGLADPVAPGAAASTTSSQNKRAHTKKRGKNRRGKRPAHKITVPKPALATAASGAAPAATEALAAMEDIAAPVSIAAAAAAASSSSAVLLLQPSKQKRQSRKQRNHFLLLKKQAESKAAAAAARALLPRAARRRPRPPPSLHCMQVRVLSTLVRFLLSDLVLPLLRTNFYCTDTEGSKHRVVYFRREIWAEVARRSMEGLTDPSSRGMFVKMERAAAVEYLQKRLAGGGAAAAPGSTPAAAAAASIDPSSAASSAPLAAVFSPSSLLSGAGGFVGGANGGFGLGVAKLRLRPRKNGTVRPIVNMARGGSLRVITATGGANAAAGSGTLAALADLHGKSVTAAAAPSSSPATASVSYPPINSVLRNLFEVLRYEKDSSNAPAVAQSGTGAAAASAPPSRASSVSAAGASAHPKPSPSASASASAASAAAAAPKKKSSNILGCSVFGINAIYTRFRNFAQQWKSLKPIGGSESGAAAAAGPAHARSHSRSRPRAPALAPLYGVCVDVRHCFDTINRVKLLSLLSSILTSPSYSLSRYTTLRPAFGVVRPKFLRSVQPSDEIPMFVAECMRRSTVQRHAVFSDQVARRFVDREQLMHLLREHLYQNFVQLNDGLFHQRDGIPQGSVLSSLLCCVYLAHIEKRIILPQLMRVSAPAKAPASTATAAANAAAMHRSQSSLPATTNRPPPPTSSAARAGLPPAPHASPVKAASVGQEQARKRGRQGEEERKESDVTRIISPSAANDAAVKRARLSASSKAAFAASFADAIASPAGASAAASAASPPSASSASAALLSWPAIHLLVRQMDDFLYLTTSLVAARRFLQLMSAGFKEPFGMEINGSKTRVWLGEEYHAQREAAAVAVAAAAKAKAKDAMEDESKTGCAAAAADLTLQPISSRVLNWNGYLIDVPTLGISSDYSRLRSDPTDEAPPAEAAADAVLEAEEEAEEKAADAAAAASVSRPIIRPSPDRSSLADSLTLDYISAPGSMLRKSFHRFLHPKIHPLLFDPLWISWRNACRNLQENFAISIAKTMVQLREMRRMQSTGRKKSNDGNKTSNSKSKPQKAAGKANASPSSKWGGPSGENQWFLLQILLEGVEYCLNLAHGRARMHTPKSSGAADGSAAAHSSSSAAAGPFVSRFPLSNLQLRFLALHAYLFVLRRKQTRWKLLTTFVGSLVQPAHHAWLLRFEKTTPLAAAANSVAAPADAACPPWPECVHVGLYRCLTRLRSQHKAGSAPLGNVPMPASLRPAAGTRTGRKKARAAARLRPAQRIVRSESRGAAISALAPAAASAAPHASTSLAPSAIPPRARAKSGKRRLNEGTPAEGAAAAVPLDRPSSLQSKRARTEAAASPSAAAAASSASSLRDAPSSSRPALLCICGASHAPPLAMLSAAELQQLRAIRSLLPWLEEQLHSVLKQIRF